MGGGRRVKEGKTKGGKLCAFPCTVLKAWAKGADLSANAV